MVPGWLNKRKAKLEQDATEKKLKDARESLATKIIRDSGVVYFGDLLKELKDQCENLPEVGFKGVAYDLPNPHNPLELCTRIDVEAKKTWPESAFALLLYSAGTSIVRVSGEIPKLREFSFYIFGEDVKASPNHSMSHMNPSQCAEYLLESLLDVIERRS
jgi:hypothetical protein